MTYEVAISPYETSHVQSIRTLFASYFEEGDRLLTERYSEWLYSESPFGRALIVTVTEAGAWVGFMAMVPVTLVKHGARLPGYYVVNVLVHPSHHGKNLFGRMIDKASERVSQENAALLGHPNDLAIKSWQRCGMHFHEPLVPTIEMPFVRARGVRVSDIQTAAELAPLIPSLQGLSDRWTVEPSAHLIEWRYLRHPTNSYRVQRIDVDGAPAGIQVSKRYRRGVHLLVEQMVDDRFALAASARLPLVTFGLRTASASQRMSPSARPIPRAKQLPFFCTHHQSRLDSAELGTLGLTASDF